MAWARDGLPQLVAEFWSAARAMEVEIGHLREVDDPRILKDAESVGMKGFAAMGAVLEKLELVAPAEVAYRAAIYMDALDEERLLILDGSRSGEPSAHDFAIGRLGPQEEFLNSCRKTMGLDSYSTVGLNAARVRAASVHPRAPRRHLAAQQRLQRAYQQGPRWWRR